jgi:hypothetical protein
MCEIRLRWRPDSDAGSSLAAPHPHRTTRIRVVMHVDRGRPPPKALKDQIAKIWELGNALTTAGTFHNFDFTFHCLDPQQKIRRTHLIWWLVRVTRACGVA